jgi:hypothetical protein
MLAAQQVVDAIASRITGLALTGARAYTSRMWPLSEADLPAWRVFAVDEDIEPTTVHSPFVQTHALQIELRGAARAVADLDDTLNALASQALTALFNPPGVADALSVLLQRVALTTRRIERAMATEGEAAVGLATLTLRAEFRTLSNAPDTIL